MIDSYPTHSPESASKRGPEPASRLAVWKIAAASLLHALLFVLSFPPFNVWPCIVLSLIPLLYIATQNRSSPSGRSFLIVWAGSTLGYLWIQRWLTVVALAGLGPLALILGIYSAIFVFLIQRIRSKRLERNGSSGSLIFIAPVLWTGLEYFRGELFFDGYPWFLVGHPLVEWPILCQVADLGGAYMVSFATVGLAAGIFDIALAFSQKGDPPSSRFPRVIIPVAVLVTGVVSILGYGQWRLSQTPDIEQAEAADTFTVLAIQTNMPQDNKLQWSSQQQFTDFISFLELMAEGMGAAESASKPSAVNLIVWPETSVPGLVFSRQSRSEIERFERETGFTATGLSGVSGTYYEDQIVKLSNQFDTPMLLGATRFENLRMSVEEKLDQQGQPAFWMNTKYDSHYNSAILYSPTLGRTDDRYDKIRLTPFGETMPYIRAWPWLQNKMLAIGAGGMTFDLNEGTRFHQFEVPTSVSSSSSIHVATPICFESTVASVCRKLVRPDGERSKATDVLINLTNDGWFGHAPGGRWQHLQIGRFRCIENRVPMIRCANTGVSASIDSAGRLTAVGPNIPSNIEPTHTSGSLVTTVVRDPRISFFSTFGYLFGVGTLFVALILILNSFFRRP